MTISAWASTGRKTNFTGHQATSPSSNIITALFGGFIAKAATTTISFADGSFDGVLKALREQGDLRVVSSHESSHSNNQPALVKVATDDAFFYPDDTPAGIRHRQHCHGTGPVGHRGLVLSVTPQISDDGWITLDVTPIISRLRDIRTSPQGTATAPSSTSNNRRAWSA